MGGVSLGGFIGIQHLIHCLRRNFEEFKFAYINNTAEYKDNGSVKMNIQKKFYQGNVCFEIETIYGKAYIAMSSLLELLKNEKFILGVGKKLETLLVGYEKQFDEMVVKGMSDFSSLITDIEQSADTFASEIMINFNNLLKMAIETANANPSIVATTVSTASTPSKQKRVAQKRQNSNQTNQRASKKSKETARMEKDRSDNALIAEMPNTSVNESDNAIPIVGVDDQIFEEEEYLDETEDNETAGELDQAE